MANGIEETITTLYEMVQDAWSLPLGAEKCVVERDKVLDLLAVFARTSCLGHISAAFRFVFCYIIRQKRIKPSFLFNLVSSLTHLFNMNY